MAPRSDLSFEGFIEFQFGPAVRPRGNPWYFDVDADWWEPEPRTGIAYLTRLFSNGPEALQWFSDVQIAQGLDGLINTAVTGGLAWMVDPITPAAERAGVWSAVARFFTDLLAPRCSSALGHLSEPGAPLNLRTYMWWDGFPPLTWGDEPGRGVIEDAELTCLEAVLAIESAACQEAALHGLGHFAPAERSTTIIDAYLERGQFARPELAAYARAARVGDIQ